MGGISDKGYGAPAFEARICGPDELPVRACQCGFCRAHGARTAADLRALQQAASLEQYGPAALGVGSRISVGLDDQGPGTTAVEILHQLAVVQELQPLEELEQPSPSEVTE